MIELYRAIIPAKHIINDNHDQHYRIHQGNLDWLSKQFKRLQYEESYNNEHVNFVLPDINFVKNYIEDKPILIRCEVWRCVNRLFDPQNYAKTFKAPIDLLVKEGYLPDDNWKFVSGIMYSGGGSSVWDRAYRYEKDRLPSQLLPDWWNDYSDNFGDILIRILIGN